MYANSVPPAAEPAESAHLSPGSGPCCSWASFSGTPLGVRRAIFRGHLRELLAILVGQGAGPLALDEPEGIDVAQTPRAEAVGHTLLGHAGGELTGAVLLQLGDQLEPLALQIGMAIVIRFHALPTLGHRNPGFDQRLVDPAFVHQNVLAIVGVGVVPLSAGTGTGRRIRRYTPLIRALQ